MRLSLRAKFMLWLLGLISAIYLALGLALFAFNLHQLREHPGQVEEEREEMFVVYGLMVALLPLAVLAAWRVTAQLLQPLRAMLHAAAQIRQGGLEQRIETPLATDELGQLAITLNEAFDNYHRVLERIDRFSLDAAHQLRSPLASMRASGEVCLQRERSIEEYQDVIAGMVEDARRLGHTVDQLLLLARLARKELSDTFEPLDLAVLALELVENLNPAFESAGVRLETRYATGPFMVRGARLLLEQAMANLLDNALRHTPRGGCVVLELGRPTPGRIMLNVADSGPGLGQTERSGASAPRPVASDVRSKDGAGLGLLIVSNVVRAHGGTLQVKVSEWGGASFTLDFQSAD